MKIIRYLILQALLIMVFTACHTPKNIVANLDLNNLKTGLDTFRKHHPIIYNGDVVTVNINNVNKDLYTVKLSGSVISFNTTVPASLNLSSIVLPGSVAAPEGRHTATRHAPSCAELIQREKDNIDDGVDSFKKADNNINKAIVYNNHLLLLQKECGLSCNDIRDTAGRALFDIVTSYNITDLPKFIDNNISAALNAYSVINRSLMNIDAYLNCDSCKNSIKKAQTQNFTDSEKAMFAELKDDYGKILTFAQTGQKYTIVQNYRAVTNPSNYRLSLVDTAHNADAVIFNVKISPKNWMPCRAVDTSFNINLKVARFKIDFSTGIFLNFGGSSFTGKNYFIDSTGRIGQINKNNNVTIPSIGALAHFYYRSTTAIDPGLVLGTSLSTDVKYTNFHVGLSLMFNANNEVFNRIALSGGLTYRYVSELNNSYRIGQKANTSLTIDQIETGKFIRGGFIALTYNLSKN